MMQLGCRPRFPASLHSFLTSISAEEQRGGKHTKDGISLPVNVCDLTPACEDDESGGSSSSSLARPCSLCVRKRACYTCPRCNVPYCSLSCYRGDRHKSCSEDFYKECVKQELKLLGKSDQQERKSIREILLRMRSSDGAQTGKTEKEEQVATENLRLLSRLAELEERGVEGHEQEVEMILHQLEDTDEEVEEDLASRLSEVNIDALTRDELWDLLPEKEKQMFQQLLEDGDVGAVVPLWHPWWEKHEGETLIQELQSSLDHTWIPETPDIKQQNLTCVVHKPPLSEPVPPLSSLCATPSPAVRFTLLNALYAYTFSLRLFNGDVSDSLQQLEFSQLLLSVSKCLGHGQTFNTFTDALNSAMTAACLHDSDSALSALPAVAHVLSGRSPSDPVGYTLSALAHMSSVFKQVRADAPRADSQFRRACLLAGKKCTFLQAWATEGWDQLKFLARETWKESGRVIEEIERTRHPEVEQSNQQRGRKLIQEIK